MALLNSANGVSKASQRLLLDLRAAIPRPIRNSIEAAVPQRLGRMTWLLLCLALLLVLVSQGARLGHSHSADVIHLDSLVQKYSKDETLEAQSAPGNSAEDTHGSEPDILTELAAATAGDDVNADAEVHEDVNRSNVQDDLDEGPDDYHKDQYGRDIPHYREIFSVSTRDRKYFIVWWDGERAYNPNLIPHPTLADKWIVVAQKEQYDEDINVSAQLVCTAGFVFGALMCDEHPTELPVAPSITGNCQGDLAYANFRTGPRDGRMFYGPLEPYVMWGSQSAYACFGLWLQDARMLLEPFHLEQRRVGLFRDAMELKRPEPWHVIEKNFFLFWDAQGMVYVHYDLWPTRVFARLNYDGGAGPDLAPAAAGIDARCMASFMPLVRNGQESIHQATNSLSITLCKRTDPRCIPNDDNTYIIHVFHWKSFYEFHGGYEPYVVLFKRSAPFAMHAISQRPIWIHGRSELTEASQSVRYRKNPSDIPPGHTEFFYITSISWKRHGSRYHGYIDDVMFLAFGVEDAKCGVIDVTAADLLQDLAFCDMSMPD